MINFWIVVSVYVEHVGFHCSVTFVCELSFLARCTLELSCVIVEVSPFSDW